MTVRRKPLKLKKFRFDRRRIGAEKHDNFVFRWRCEHQLGDGALRHVRRRAGAGAKDDVKTGESVLLSDSHWNANGKSCHHCVCNTTTSFLDDDVNINLATEHYLTIGVAGAGAKDDVKTEENAF